MRILVINAGSSSIKFALFDGDLVLVLSGMAEGIGAKGSSPASLKIGKDTRRCVFATHTDALAAILAALQAQGIQPSDLSAAAHRVVHGGAQLTAPVRLTPDILTQIQDCVPLAPLHNPHNLAAIVALQKVAPKLAQFASFDTAFHATMPAEETLYALPQKARDLGLRRYGFHGSSYAALVRCLPEVSGAPVPRRLLALHLGNGVSLCAIKEGKSYATTMGYSPLEGPPMGTRSGSLDANAVLSMVDTFGREDTYHMLNKSSGLLGLSGQSADMRTLLGSNAPSAKLAVDHFCHWVLRHAGGLIAAMGGVDTIAFTGGIGENAAPIRATILDRLAWLGVTLDDSANVAHRPCVTTPTSSIPAWIVPAQEERQIALDAMQTAGSAQQGASK